MLRTGLVGGVLTAALLVPASMLGLPDAASADCCMRCRVASAASDALAAALLAASSSLSPTTTDPVTVALVIWMPSTLFTSHAQTACESSEAHNEHDVELANCDFAAMVVESCGSKVKL